MSDTKQYTIVKVTEGKTKAGKDKVGVCLNDGGSDFWVNSTKAEVITGALVCQVGSTVEALIGFNKEGDPTFLNAIRQVDASINQSEPVDEPFGPGSVPKKSHRETPYWSNIMANSAHGMFAEAVKHGATLAEVMPYIHEFGNWLEGINSDKQQFDSEGNLVDDDGNIIF